MQFKHNSNAIQMQFKHNSNAFQMQLKYNSKAIQLHFKCNSNAIQMQFKGFRAVGLSKAFKGILEDLRVLYALGISRDMKSTQGYCMALKSF